MWFQPATASFYSTRLRRMEGPSRFLLPWNEEFYGAIYVQRGLHHVQHRTGSQVTLIALQTRTSAGSTIPLTSTEPAPPNRQSLSLDSSERRRLIQSEESSVTALSSYTNSAQGRHTTAYTSGRRQSWTFRRPSNLACEMVVIADSNGANWKTTTSTLTHHIHAFRGARLRDIHSTLTRSVDQLSNCTNIIVAAGINDRTSDHPTNIYTDLFAIQDWGRQHKKTVSFLEIPNVQVPLQQRERIEAINEAAMDVFQQTFIVIEASSVSFTDTDSSGIHYTPDTAPYFFQLCADFLGHTI